MSHWILIFQLLSTLCMTGIIWFVQIVHYPLFSGVGRLEFPQYEKSHQRLTTLVVAPLMLLELATAVFLACWPPAFADGTKLWSALGLLIVIWLSTLFLQMPLHATLNEQFDAASHRRLVMGNWLRTIAWSVRTLLLLLVVQQGLS